MNVQAISEPKRRILLVDDNPKILDDTAELLRQRGYEVVTSPTSIGVGALVLREGPDVLVLDVMMPALDGQKLAELVRNRQTDDRVPIVFYTALEEEQVYRISRKVVGSSYVLKSDGPMVLASELGRVLTTS